MKITRNQLKQIIRESLITEAEEQAEFKKGDKVLAVWKEDGEKYPGSVVSVGSSSGAPKVLVRWDNPDGGELTTWTDESDVELSKAAPETKESGSSSESLQREILWKVLAAEGESKDWDDLTKLDGGTVGIAHFASGGLVVLYETMGDDLVKKYFSPHNPEITSVQALKDATKNNYGGHCQQGSSKHPIRGTCWRMEWWKTGMREFLAGSESKDVQFKAWQNVTALPAEQLISAWGGEWNTKRGRSIAYSLVNSGGPSFLQKHAKNGKLSPNDAMEAYNRWYHAKEGGSVRSRMRILNKLYPDPNFKPTFQPSKYA